ncbi:MAG TPA: hemin uptake protein HemP [Methylophilaceae bacterium]|nr:hemin uptake protein HemP [Methylophilaceae bacterium]
MIKSSLLLDSDTVPHAAQDAARPQLQAGIESKTKTSNIKIWSSKELFSGARELLIEHAGGEYRLRLTNQGKLILTK